MPLIRGDVADPQIVAEAMRDIDGCFHLAAVASVERGNLDWVGSHRTNVTGAVTVFDAARRCNERPTPVVYASSAAVYGDIPDIPLSENNTVRPVSAYGADKYGCELHGYIANLIHGVPNRGLRFFNVYGPRQDPKSPYSGVITIFYNRIKDGMEITINGDGYHTRDYIYVGDIVKALQAAMTHCAEQGGSDVFNVCTGIENTVLDVVFRETTISRPSGVWRPRSSCSRTRSVPSPIMVSSPRGSHRSGIALAGSASRPSS